MWIYFSRFSSDHHTREKYRAFPPKNLKKKFENQTNNKEVMAKNVQSSHTFSDLTARPDCN